MEDAASVPGEVVVIPTGAPLAEAAAWVGQACWLELRFHDVLTAWLAVEQDPAAGLALWQVRSHRADLAERWHRRLPELREMPRADQVRPGPGPLVDALDRAMESTAPDGTAERLATALAILGDLAGRLADHRAVAVGPADGPAAETLSLAIEVTAHDRELLGQVSFNRT